MEYKVYQKSRKLIKAKAKMIWHDFRCVLVWERRLFLSLFICFLYSLNIYVFIYISTNSYENIKKRNLVRNRIQLLFSNIDLSSESAFHTTFMYSTGYEIRIVTILTIFKNDEFWYIFCCVNKVSCRLMKNKLYLLFNYFSGYFTIFDCVWVKCTSKYILLCFDKAYVGKNNTLTIGGWLLFLFKVVSIEIKSYTF